MTVWLVSREYAGIAEAGGVKNVSAALSESLVKMGHKVVLFIPLYACTSMDNINSFSCMWHRPVRVTVEGKKRTVTFGHGSIRGVEIVFVCHKSFSEKHGVYTYTKEEEAENPEHKKGSGHEDCLILNTLFQKSVIAYSETCSAHESPDIIHSQDATAAMIPVFVRDFSGRSAFAADFFSRTKCVVTIHNAGPGYHHEYPDLGEACRITGVSAELLSPGLSGACVEPFLLAIAHGATVTTVSPQYAEEISDGTVETAGLSEAFRRLGVRILGITNGVDLERYDPRDTTVSLLPASYDTAHKDLLGKYECRGIFLHTYASRNRTVRELEPPEQGSVERYGYLMPLTPDEISAHKGSSNPIEPVYIAYHGRVVQQKGIDVLSEGAGMLLEKNLPVRFIFIGQGQPELERKFMDLTEKYAGKCVFFRGYDKMLSRLCIASADFAVFPSNFEPCGLEDFIAQIYGTLPVAHATGGLCKIVDDETGFLYRPNTPEKLYETLYSLVKIRVGAGANIFSNMISYAARYVWENYNWGNVAKKYVELYQNLLDCP